MQNDASNSNTRFLTLTTNGRILATPWLTAETRVQSLAQCMWDLRRVNWHWTSFSPPVLVFSPVSIIPPVLMFSPVSIIPPVLMFSPVSIIPPVLHTQLIHHRRYVIFAVDSVGKQITVPSRTTSSIHCRLGGPWRVWMCWNVRKFAYS